MRHRFIGRHHIMAQLIPNLAKYFFSRSVSFVDLRASRDTANNFRPASLSVSDRLQTVMALARLGQSNGINRGYLSCG